MAQLKPLRSGILRLQYASNLHVYCRPFAESRKLLNPIAPNLALLGDIGRADCKRTTRFMKWCSDTYETIYWVPGYTEMASEKRPWFYQLDAIQEMLFKHNINNVVFGTKRDIHLSNPSVQILMATLWYPEKSSKGIQTFCETNKIRPAEPEDIEVCLEGEMDWKLIRTGKSATPIVWLTYCSPFRSLTPYNAASLLNHPKLLCSLVGTHALPISMSGKLPGHPWVGINMHGYYNYNEEAFWEYDESRRKPGGSLSGLIKNMEQSIRDQLYQPQHLPPPAVIMN
jgi:hypothetical protein